MIKGSKKSIDKNKVILIVSALLIVISVLIAFFTIKGTGFMKKSGTDNKPAVTQKAKDNTEKEKTKASDKKGSDKQASESETADETPETTAEAKPYVFSTGKYKIATKDDPLGLRIEPNTDSQRVLYIDRGEIVEVIAVWDDWGYVVYSGHGGWLSMNYLEAVSSTPVTTTSNADE